VKLFIDRHCTEVKGSDIGIIYGGTRGTSTSNLLDWGTVPPLFKTQVKNLLSWEVIIID